MHLLPALSCLISSAALLSAQCPFQSAVSQPFGTGCSEVFGNHPTLAVTLDPVHCTLVIDVDVETGCCNTFLQGSMLALGLQPASLPLSVIDPACTLYVQSPVVLVQATPMVPGRFALVLPPSLPPMTLYAQGAGFYYTTISFPLPHALHYSLTSGYAIDLQ